jgi:hypothetical protein
MMVRSLNRGCRSWSGFRGSEEHVRMRRGGFLVIGRMVQTCCFDAAETASSISCSQLGWLWTSQLKIVRTGFIILHRVAVRRTTV